MILGRFKKVLLATSAAVLMFAFGAADAHAGWGSFGGGSHGSWGGSRGLGSSGGSSGGSWGGSSGGRVFGGSRGGPLRNLASRIHSRHSSGGSSGGSWGGGSLGSRGHGSSGGFSRRGFASRGGSSGGSRGYSSRGYHGSSGGSSGGYSYYSASSGGSTGHSTGHSSGGYHGISTYSQPAPVYSQPVISQPYYNTAPTFTPSYDNRIQIQNDFPIQGEPNPATDQGTPPPGPDQTGSGDAGDNTALLNLRVPVEAVVYVNGRRTSTPGSFRSYVSRNLKPGKQYTYEVRAELERDGRTLTRTKVIQLANGANKTFDIEFEEQAEMITSVTLFVPEDAKVLLGGVETKMTGATRFFSTTSLKEGQSWESYKVAVVVERDGKPVTRERVIDVNAGDSVNLRFDFDTGAQIATR